MLVHRAHSAAKSNKWPVRLDVHGAVTKWELKARESHLHETLGLFQKAVVPASPLSDGPQRIIGEYREKPLRKSEIICCSGEILKSENMLQTSAASLSFQTATHLVTVLKHGFH